MLDALVPEVSLQGPGIDAVVGELEAAGMAQHVWMRLDFEPCRLCGSFQHPGEACRRKWRATLRDEHERGCLGFPLQLPKGAHFQAGQGVRCRCALFDSTDVQDGPIEVHLIPAKVA